MTSARTKIFWRHLSRSRTARRERCFSIWRFSSHFPQGALSALCTGTQEGQKWQMTDGKIFKERALLWYGKNPVHCRGLFTSSNRLPIEAKTRIMRDRGVLWYGNKRVPNESKTDPQRTDLAGGQTYHKSRVQGALLKYLAIYCFSFVVRFNRVHVCFIRASA